MANKIEKYLKEIKKEITEIQNDVKISDEKLAESIAFELSLHFDVHFKKGSKLNDSLFTLCEKTSGIKSGYPDYNLSELNCQKIKKIISLTEKIVSNKNYQIRLILNTVGQLLNFDAPLFTEDITPQSNKKTSILYDNHTIVLATKYKQWANLP